MKKLAMTIEDLVVTSFETEAEGEERGTVAAHLSGFTCPYCKTVLTRDCCTP
ncbi:MAG TPA: pinensin family lanthipeptide [Longimicrobium sp.]|nr:pinensin family lanthipeptide [Longimicrobium sp.]